MFIKAITALILTIITWIYLIYILGYMMAHFSSTSFKDLFSAPLLIPSVLGILGLAGIWMLFLINDFKNKSVRRLTFVFIILGMISALLVADIIFSLERNILEGWPKFMLTWGLIFLTVIVAIFTKIKLFPKKNRLTYS
jgi:hypothetical protein